MNEPKHKLTVKVLGELRTIQGDTYEEFVEERDKALAGIQGDVEFVNLVRAASNAAPLVTGGDTIAPAPVAAPAPSASWDAPAAIPTTFGAAATQMCDHGPMTARTGVGAKGPWRGWFCPTPKGTPGQCKAQFVNRGTAEWNNFPA
jgi:hypothetical protein